MPGDLVGGAYPLSYSFRKSLGLQANAAQGNLCVRSNLEFPQIGGTVADQAAALTSGSATVVAVPVENGDVYTTVGVQVGATAAGTPTHQWVQLYSGALTTAVPIASQSVDGTTTAIPASKLYTFTLPSGVVINTNSTANGGNAPYGYIYVAIGFTGTTAPSLACASVATAVGYPLFTNSPYAFAGTYTAAGGTAPTSLTLASITRQANVPAVYLY